MKHFSVERDTQSVIPFILAAQAENPQFSLFASPWSPPGWMKENGRMDTTDAAPKKAKPENRTIRIGDEQVTVEIPAWHLCAFVFKK